MRNKSKILAAIAIAAVVAIAGAGLMAIPRDGGSDRGPVTMTDFLGREVTIESSDRIVSQDVNTAAILCGLGVSSRLVGVSSDDEIYSEDPRVIGMTDDDFPKAIRDGIDGGRIKELGGMYNMSAETMVSVESDLIIMGTYGTNENIRKALDALGATYIVVNGSPNGVQDVYDKIAMMGKAVGREAQADRVVSEMRSAIGKISGWCERIVAEERGGDRLDVALMMTRTYAVGPGYISGSILGGLCVDNVFEGAGRYMQVSAESIAAADPEVLIYQNIGVNDGIDDPAGFVAGLGGDPVLGGTRAAGSGSVFATVKEAKNAVTYYNQGLVRTYATWAMFVYRDYLPFDVPHLLDGGNYMEHLTKFWAEVGG
ncbi:MAG: ABC transporter substrate-binding protein [Candidatus Methanoplasma sp.]|jgi:ABC-type Fe3+-hydroxamate transport system substrate-binding protein|nr:ABC transporter substrate-binding protein [Candidatus Methanoplasma sp.]